MFTAESSTQVFVLLLTLLEDGHNICCVAYDTACSLHPFLKRLSKDGNVGAKLLLEKIDFMVDRWHIRKHKKKVGSRN